MVKYLKLLKDRIILSNKDLERKYKEKSNSKINLPLMKDPECGINEDNKIMSCFESNNGVLKQMIFTKSNEKPNFVSAIYTTRFKINDEKSKQFLRSNSRICDAGRNGFARCIFNEIHFAADEPSRKIEKLFNEEFKSTKIIP